MKKLLFTLVFVVIAFASCNVQERIIFNEHMGGTYESSFDLSEMLKIAAEGNPESGVKEKKKVDTLFVFNDLMEEYKDSIATLSPEKRAELEKMKDMKMRMVMDEEEGIFKISVNKDFDNFEEVAFASYQMDEMMNMAKAQSGQQSDQGGMNDMLKSDKVLYTFNNNTFTRVDAKLAEMEMEEEAIDDETDEQSQAEEDLAAAMMEGMLGEFEDALRESMMILEYTFPKKIKSVSHENAVISDDGKTVRFAVDWKTLSDNKKLLENFEVVLEEK